jgi:hypothetical protein
MSNFSVENKEQNVVGTATFHKETDYKVIEMGGILYCEHKIMADKLIAKGVAKLAKNQAIEMGEAPIQETVLGKVKK